MLKKYDEKFLDMPFLSMHPDYLPFVGDNYEQYRILHIGESHYIWQTLDNCPYDVSYMMAHWWDNTLDNAFLASTSGWYNTRDVVANYLSGRRRRGHIIFTNIVKCFSEAVLNEPIPHITTEESQKYNYLAFMNFFQMPSLLRGKKFWDSLVATASDKSSAVDAWNKTVQESTKVLDGVIDILRPSLVVFTSRSAYNAYVNSQGAHYQDSNIIQTSHPGTKYWNGDIQRLLQKMKSSIKK